MHVHQKGNLPTRSCFNHLLPNYSTPDNDGIRIKPLFDEGNIFISSSRYSGILSQTILWLFTILPILYRFSFFVTFRVVFA